MAMPKTDLMCVCVRVRELTRSLGKKYIVLSMFFTATQQLTWALADSIHTFPNRYTTPIKSHQVLQLISIHSKFLSLRTPQGDHK